jgi:murein DD-endopeptidase MepM/ murein hydrolase activator NlpD
MSVSRPRLVSSLALGFFFASLFAPAAHGPEARAEIARVTPTAAPPPAESILSRRLRAAPGATLSGVLADAGVASEEARDAIDALRPVWNPRALKPGQEIALQFGAHLTELRFAGTRERDVVVARAGDGHFITHAEPRYLARVPVLAAGVIRSSLSAAARDAGVPPPILAEMIGAFSYDVDFQRDLQPNDSFELLYEQLYDRDGKPAGSGNIAYAAMTLSGKTLSLYRYLPAGAKTAAFFTARGESVKKALLRTPLDGGRLSSGFGMRTHPILGYSKMHRGVDFAAPAGTPILAAGDGTVESAGRGGAYGNLVVLRHGNGLATAYAHMSRIAHGVAAGAQIAQGAVIGYVGATGRATGPHLHYELRVRGEAANPLAVKMQPGQPLADAERVAFAAAEQAIDREVMTLRQATIVAALPSAGGAE